MKPMKATDRIMLTAIASSTSIPQLEEPEPKVLKYLRPDFDVDAHNNSSSLPPIKSRYKQKEEIAEKKRTGGRSVR